MKNVTLRIAKSEDLKFLFDVSNKAMEPVTEALNHTKKTLSEYKEVFEPEKIEIIQYQGKDVGRLRIVRSIESIYIGGIQILPDFQGKGIGTEIMEDLTEESKRQNIPITLEVHEVNTKAKAFYMKCGFKIVETVGEKLALKYQPN